MSTADLDAFREAGRKTFPGLVGLEIVELEPRRAAGTLELGEQHLAPNGYLHAGTVVTLADTVCGYGCIASLPEGRTGFTTVELKANFLASAREGALRCEGKLVHGGRSTQVWDATVTDDAGRTLALFRCTQFLL